MNNNDFEKVLDSLLDDASQRAATNIGNSLSENDADISFSQEHLKKMNKIFKKEQSSKRSRKLKNVSKIAACFFVAIILTSSIAIFSVEAWRNMFLNYVFDSSEPNTDFTFNESNTIAYSDNLLTICYIPDNFEIVDNHSSSRRSSVYCKFNEQFFHISLEPFSSKTSIDSEDGTISNITINGYDAVLIQAYDTNSIIWSDNTSAFSITGNISLEEIKKIAENVKHT